MGWKDLFEMQFATDHFLHMLYNRTRHHTAIDINPIGNGDGGGGGLVRG